MHTFDYTPRCAAKIEEKVGNRERTPVSTSPFAEEPSLRLLKATAEACEAGIRLWARERCMFRDGCWGSLGALHTDYAEWCDKVGRKVPGSFRSFKKLLQESGFAITDDGRVSGLILIDEVRAFQKSRVQPLHRGA
jgi:hypothetical protein